MCRTLSSSYDFLKLFYINFPKSNPIIGRTDTGLQLPKSDHLPFFMNCLIFSNVKKSRIIWLIKLYILMKNSTLKLRTSFGENCSQNFIFSFSAIVFKFGFVLFSNSFRLTSKKIIKLFCTRNAVFNFNYTSFFSVLTCDFVKNFRTLMALASSFLSKDELFDSRQKLSIFFRFFLKFIKNTINLFVQVILYKLIRFCF